MLGDVVTDGFETFKRWGDLCPGAHLIVLGAYEDCLKARRVGFEVRDTFLVLEPSGSTFAFLLRKPCSEGTVAENVLRYGTGALNIDGCRVSTNDKVETHAHGPTTKSHGKILVGGGDFKGIQTGQSESQKLGRWPSNLVFVHGSGCRREGTKRVAATSVPRDAPTQAVRRSGVHSEAKGHQTIGRVSPVTGHADSDGMETVAAWACESGCPVAELDEQSGITKSGSLRAEVQRGKFGQNGCYGRSNGSGEGVSYAASEGGASRFYPQFENREALYAWFRHLIGLTQRTL